MAERTSIALTERSMPAVMITNVEPIASSISCDASRAIFWKLVRSANFWPCQTLNAEIRIMSTTPM
jgi:hypothetical protein